jgi:hypothetical protein
MTAPIATPYTFSQPDLNSWGTGEGLVEKVSVYQGSRFVATVGKNRSGLYGVWGRDNQLLASGTRDEVRSFLRAEYGLCVKGN